METINNKTLEKLKYELVRDGIVSYETLEKAEELANVQNINIGQALINSGILLVQFFRPIKLFRRFR